MTRYLALAIVLALCPTVGAEPQDDEPQDDAAPALRRLVKVTELWKSSCRGTGGDTCARLVKVQHRDSCQSASHQLRVGRRNQAAARKIKSRLVRALSRVEGASQEPQLAQHRGRIAHARFLLAEADFEALANIKPPRGLNFSERSPKRKLSSERRFLAFFQQAQKQHAAVVTAYQRVLAVPAGPSTQEWHIAAIARMARTQRLFAEQLYSMEIPEDLRTGAYAADSIAAFCDAVGAQAEQFEESSQRGATHCSALTKDDGTSLWRAECLAMQEPIGELTDARVVQRIVGRKRDEFRSCFRSLKESKQVTSKLKLHLRVDAQGQVDTASASGSPADDELAECISGAAGDLIFPRPVGGSHHIVYPITLTR